MRRVVVLLLAFVCLATVPNAGKIGPQQTAIEIKGIKDRITIRRDERGIPYIEAQNDEDLYFGQGYATATDRLWQMDLYRRTARGELAEIFTAGPNNFALEQDKLHRTYGFAQTAEAELAQASARTRAMLEAYARGVNAYASSLDPKSMPPEFQILQYSFRPWVPADTFVVAKIFAEGLSDTWRLDVMRQALSVLPAEKRAELLPEVSPIDVLVVGKDTQSKAKTARLKPEPISTETLAKLAHNQAVADAALDRIGFHAEALAASNNWVVSGKHTVSGKPLLSNDPHLPPSAPPIWYLVQLSAPGVRVAGVSTAGIPGVIIGHNDHIAWGFTNVGPDVQDLYIEKFDPNNPKRYQTPSGWQDAVIRREEIKVRKGFMSAEHDVVTHEVTVTRHGPIIFEGDGKRYALRWTALDPSKNNADGQYTMNRARNWKEFNTALESFTAPTQNIVYADIDGHIGYHAAGVIPIRKSGDGSVPYDGSTDAGEWTSYIPVPKLPTLFDPPSGIIVTANQRIVGTDYPYFLTHSWAQPYRARRITNLLNEKPKLSSDDIRRILGDTYSIAGALFAQEAVKLLRPKLTPADEKLRATLDAFEKWDGRVNAESTVAPVVGMMRLSFRSKILTAALGQELVRNYQWSNFDTTLDRVLKERPASWLPKQFASYEDLLKACYEEAISNLTQRLGADQTKWTWGDYAKARFPHPLGGAP
ncbi:MAG TPA: penicillin acylase family protein, partial [Pyrinomonadaceae bacterium]